MNISSKINTIASCISSVPFVKGEYLDTSITSDAMQFKQHNTI